MELQSISAPKHFCTKAFLQCIDWEIMMRPGLAFHRNNLSRDSSQQYKKCFYGIHLISQRRDEYIWYIRYPHFWFEVLLISHSPLYSLLSNVNSQDKEAQQVSALTRHRKETRQRTSSAWINGEGCIRAPPWRFSTGCPLHPVENLQQIKHVARQRVSDGNSKRK